MKTFSYSRWITACLIAGALAHNCSALAKQETAKPDVSNPKTVAGQIDALVEKKLSEMKLKPNALSSDEVFLRRVYLDVVGRVPTKREALEFLKSEETDKREKLIDQLLSSEGYVQNYFNYWADILRLKHLGIGGQQSLAAGLAYSKWIKESLRTNKPYNQFVRELITADGKTYENGAVGFYIRDFNMPLDNMAVTTQIFLGTQMVCAQCHDHPFDNWSQKEYYQMAAHTYGMTGTNALKNPEFNRTLYPTKKNAGQNFKPEERKEMVRAMTEILRPLRYNTVLTLDKPIRLPGDYRYKDAKANDIIAPMIPAGFSGSSGASKITKEGEKPVQSYAEWMTSPSNPRFTLVVANRLWKKVMGMGVIDPVDELTEATVPTNPALMDLLESTMKAVNYDMKAYLRIVLNSQTYQRTAYTKDLELGEPYYFPGPTMRRMSAEQVWDSMVTLYKPNPDGANASAALEADRVLTKIEWEDRAMNNLSVDEVVEGSKKIAEVQKQLAQDVRSAQEKLKAATASHDPEAIKSAQRTIALQRKNIDDAVEKIVYEVGFEKFAELAKEGKLQQQVDDADFAKEISFTIKQKENKNEKLMLEDALNLLITQRRQTYQNQAKVRRDKEMERLKVVTKEQKQNFAIYTTAIENTVMRAADVRAPAPNGHFLRTFGQSDRELVENSNKEGSVMQALMLLNGKYFKGLLNPYTIIARQLAAAKTTDEAIDTLYLSIMSRHASEEEKSLLKPIVENQNGQATSQGKSEALWALINTRQFLFIE
jgi:hypothetical protein